MAKTKRINVLISEDAWLAARLASVKENFKMEATLGELLEEQIKSRWMEEEKMDYGKLNEILEHLNNKGFYYLKDDTGYVELREVLASADEDEREYKLTMHDENTASVSIDSLADAGYMVYKKLSADKGLVEKIINEIEKLMAEQHYVDDSDGPGNDIDAAIAEVEPLTLEDSNDRNEIYEIVKKHLEENYKKVSGVNGGREFEQYYYKADEKFNSLEELYRHFGFPEADELD